MLIKNLIPRDMSLSVRNVNGIKIYYAAIDLDIADLSEESFTNYIRAYVNEAMVDNNTNNIKIILCEGVTGLSDSTEEIEPNGYRIDSMLYLGSDSSIQKLATNVYARLNGYKESDRTQYNYIIIKKFETGTVIKGSIDSIYYYRNNFYVLSISSKFNCIFNSISLALHINNIIKNGCEKNEKDFQLIFSSNNADAKVIEEKIVKMSSYMKTKLSGSLVKGTDFMSQDIFIPIVCYLASPTKLNKNVGIIILDENFKKQSFYLAYEKNTKASDLFKSGANLTIDFFKKYVCKYSGDYIPEKIKEFKKSYFKIMIQLLFNKKENCYHAALLLKKKTLEQYVKNYDENNEVKVSTFSYLEYYPVGGFIGQIPFFKISEKKYKYGLKIYDLDDIQKLAKTQKTKLTFIKKNKKDFLINEPQLFYDDLLMKKSKQKEFGSLFKYVAYDIETFPCNRHLNYTNTTLEEQEIIKNEESNACPYAIGLGFYKNITDSTFSSEGMNYNKIKEDYEEEYHSFFGSNCIEKFFEYVASRIGTFNECAFYGHNSAFFDTKILFNYILNSKKAVWKINNLVENEGKFVSFCLIHKETGSKIFFRDFFRLMSSSLDSITKDFNVEHKKLTGSVDHSSIHLNNYKDNSLMFKVDTYLKNDCLGLLEAVFMFGDIIYSNFKIDIKSTITAASLSKSIFYKNFYNEENCNGFKFYNLNYFFDHIIREYSYFGGNTSAFYLGEFKKKIYYYDVTSEYPFVGSWTLPIGIPTIIYGKDFTDTFVDSYGKLKYSSVKDYNSVNGPLVPSFYGFVECFATSLNFSSIQLIPLRFRGRTVFPVLKNTRMLITAETALFCELNHLYSFTYVGGIRFNYASFLKKFFTKIFEIKKQANLEKKKSLESAAKIIANSGYGYWSIKQERENVVIEDRKKNSLMEKYYNELLYEVKFFDNDIIYSFLDIIKTSFMGVHVGSDITAKARMYIFKIMTDFYYKGCSVLYCDTDSCMVDKPLCMFEDLKLKYQWDSKGKELGTVKNELEARFSEEELIRERIASTGDKTYELGFDECQITAPKSYRLYYKICDADNIKKYGPDVIINKMKGFKKPKLDELKIEKEKLKQSDLNFNQKFIIENNVKDIEGSILTKNMYVNLIDCLEINKKISNETDANNKAELSSLLNKSLVSSRSVQFQSGRKNYFKESKDNFAINIRKIKKTFGKNPYCKANYTEALGFVSPLVMYDKATDIPTNISTTELNEYLRIISNNGKSFIDTNLFEEINKKEINSLKSIVYDKLNSVDELDLKIYESILDEITNLPESESKYYSNLTKALKTKIVKKKTHINENELKKKRIFSDISPEYLQQ